MTPLSSKQVNISHYDLKRYVHYRRWASIWHQSQAITSFDPESVMEVGGGKGYLKYVLSKEGIPTTIIDIDPDLYPDRTGEITDLPCEDQEFDIACAFQVLEHIPYHDFLKGVSELLRVSKKGITFSIPDKRKAFPYFITVPGIGQYKFLIPKPLPLKPHTFDGEHYWECNSRETPLKTILKDLNSIPHVTCKHYLCVDNPYHRFFRIQKNI